MIVNLPPLGCLPALLTIYPETDSERYDAYGCLDTMNNISKAHNALLLSRVEDLRSTYTNATFYFADYYNVYIDVLKSPADYGTRLSKPSITHQMMLVFQNSDWELDP